MEIDVLSEQAKRITGSSYDGHLIVPAFFEANRYTWQNVHYLKEGDRLTPVHKTEFAKDKVFGFSHSELREWVSEKTNGRFSVDDRKLIAVDQKEANLKISRRVSSSLVKIIELLETAPKFIVAKGGITSSDVATIGLKIKKAKVLGQAAPAIPVWLTGEEAKFQHMPYIIFPGNVGGDLTLLEVVRKISR